MSEIARAALVGFIIGDALGSQVEGKTREHLRYHPVIGFRPGGVHQLPAGGWTDDSSFMLAVADAMLPEFNLVRAAQNIVSCAHSARWSPYDYVPGVGKFSADAIKRLDILLSAGMAHELGALRSRAGILENGNGALMRCLPLIFDLEQSDETSRFEKAWQLASLTHGHILSALACHIYLEIAAALRDGWTIAEAYHIVTGRLANGFPKLGALPVQHSPFKRIMNRELPSLEADDIKSTGYVVETLEAALWCLLTTSSFPECVLKAANLGGDSDTITALAGGLAGMAYGARAIPSPWVVHLSRITDIIELADQLGEHYEQSSGLRQTG